MKGYCELATDCALNTYLINSTLIKPVVTISGYIKMVTYVSYVLRLAQVASCDTQYFTKFACFLPHHLYPIRYKDYHYFLVWYLMFLNINEYLKYYLEKEVRPHVNRDIEESSFWAPFFFLRKGVLKTTKKRRAPLFFLRKGVLKIFFLRQKTKGK